MGGYYREGYQIIREKGRGRERREGREGRGRECALSEDREGRGLMT